jgi:hypothetical protein
MPRIAPIYPTELLVEQYLRRFRSDERYFLADQAITELVERFPDNSRLEHVLLKVTAINELYGTNIYATFAMARHIHALGIDSALADHSTELVDRIAGVILAKRRRSMFSFASKYCSWHAPLHYPLYDSFVAKLLCSYRREYKFGTFKNPELRSYDRYKAVVSQFRSFFCLEQFTFKELDKFLWLYGKELYPKAYGRSGLVVSFPLVGT